VICILCYHQSLIGEDAASHGLSAGLFTLIIRDRTVGIEEPQVQGLEYGLEWSAVGNPVLK
jgi:hypothetical protein